MLSTSMLLQRLQSYQQEAAEKKDAADSHRYPAHTFTPPGHLRGESLVRNKLRNGAAESLSEVCV